MTMSQNQNHENDRIEQPEAQAEAEAGASAAPEPADPVEAELEALRAERDSLRDKLMRALAEAENIRKRAERDRKEAEAYGGTKLARDVLDVYDNLGRALAAADEAARKHARALIEGIELTQRELLAAFAKNKIEQVTPEIGEKFDPKLHQAMFEAPVPNAEPGTVIQVMQHGFTISGRLLRPAMVGVAAARPAGAGEQDAAGGQGAEAEAPADAGGPEAQ
ncbi:molecular chaperone GrpE [Oceanicella actignis]|uniref:Protein GrpE n=2 Tax=Oceanicella actignis TaxID=1189325 RepID=A0A1M7SWX4_9RHOB|nr:molecular chaperone GrpE [Oceanicella actignis]SHN63027.1 molecular chaperone GrpE [Oceanicella actignis]